MEYYLVLSTIMMFVGIYGFVTRRNLLAMLISVELILNSVDINFVVFNRFLLFLGLSNDFSGLFVVISSNVPIILCLVPAVTGLNFFTAISVRYYCKNLSYLRPSR